ncbi:hypothetical protein BC335_0965 [Lactobacillus helveticus]|uniref:Uncharacterized protein n=1 Tax=Lactobacillus helveticus TaxID=1587 RepID=A0A386RE08_LACHE|nr:hypothetical protein [Lactobacillus helveticus]AYE61453.1 hypothetical protein BC335_0965 [Lactobacillus helveticus]NRO74597.1 hypothetical protein [Lactobacillus helveticus]
MTVAKILFEGKDWIHVDTSADSVNVDGKTYYPFVENPSGQYKITGTDANYNPLEIDFTISKDGKLTVTWSNNFVWQGTRSKPFDDLKVTKQPL